MNFINKIAKLLFQIYISILGAIPTIIGVKLRAILYKPFFKSVGSGLFIDSGVTIQGFENISLGNNIRFLKNSYLYANDGGEVQIGNNFSMNSNSFLGGSSGKIFIGNDCAIGPNCVLRAANHNTDDVDIPFKKQGHISGTITIEDNVWIASNCVITTNTTVQHSSIVGAGSVVTKDVEEFSVVGGVPAKLLRKRK